MNLCMEGVNSGWHGVFPLDVLSQAFDSSLILYVFSHSRQEKFIFP